MEIKNTTKQLIEEMAKAHWNYNAEENDTWDYSSDDCHQVCFKEMQAAIRRLNELGFAIVPRLPTVSMLEKAQDSWISDTLKKTTTLYDAMINEGGIRL
jgi:hypothetical protein